MKPIKPKILIVDDVKENLIVLKKTLKPYDAEILSALSADDGLKHLIENEIALIILDVNMPHMNGFEMADIIRMDQNIGTIPIIFLSADPEQEKYQSEAYDVGAIDYLSKPINEDHLGCKVKIFLELHKKNKELEYLKEQAEEASQAKSRFLSHMNHDLRTPLTSIIGYAEILKINHEESDYSTLEEDTDKITLSAEHLLDTINNILDYSESEIKKIKYDNKAIALDQFVADVRTIVFPLVQQGNNKFVVEFEDKPALIGDFQKLKQTLINVIGNAAKFTQEGKISMTFGSEQIDGNRFGSISVQDSGAGISENRIDDIFKPFEKNNQGSIESFSSTGLGLTLSQKYCTDMGGSITVKSKIGEGTTFTILIPSQAVDIKSTAA